jgi:glycosyltransferase involved in cell wall biosynthesis
MIVGVNSRAYQNSETGIPYFIKCLYQTVLKKVDGNQYVFFQTSGNKKLGETQVISLPQNNLSNIMFDTILVLFLIIKNKVDVYHSPANVLPIIKVPGVKYVLTIHDLSFLVFPEQYPRIFNMYYKAITWLSIKNADVIVADSKSTKKDILKYYNVSSNKIKVVYLGVNYIYRTNTKRARLVKDKYLFSITTHPQRKNIYGVLEALATNEHLRKYRYVIAGLIPNANLVQLKERISNLGLTKIVIVYGYASEEELISLYQNAEIFVYPSFYEGFGLPVIEAMSCGCPVIVSNNSSLIEVIPDNQWTVDPNKTNNISSKMNQLINLSGTQRKDLVKRNQKFINKFNWLDSASNYVEIFKNTK